MIRRLTLLTTLALVAAFGVRPATARQLPDGPQAPVAVGDGSSPTPDVDPFGDANAPAQPVPEPAPAAPPSPFGEDPLDPPASPAPDDPAPAPYDPNVEPVQVPASPPPGGPENLPGATDPPGGAPSTDDAPIGDPLAPSAESIRPGPNSVGLTAEVRAPSVVNLNLDSQVEIIVRNTGPADASNVIVRYPRPTSLEIVSSDLPETQKDDIFHVWQIRSLPSGQQKVITLKVRYKDTQDPVNHVATVQLQAAAKARTRVQKPALRVEVRTDKPRVLKGNKVVFDITVSNNGTHPARDVAVIANLSPGLYHPQGRSLSLPLKIQGVDVMTPGQTVTRIELEVEAREMGNQQCDVVVTSPDIPGQEIPSQPCKVEVVAPALTVELDGPSTRFPGSKGTYTLTVTNAGTDIARGVEVAIRLSDGGHPDAATPSGGKWYDSRRTLYWAEKDVPPGESRAYSVDVTMGSVGKLVVTAGAQARDVAMVYKSLETHIEGIARIDGKVIEPRGVLDVNEETEYQIRLENVGTRDAEDVKVSVKLSDNLEVVAYAGADGKEVASPAAPPDGNYLLPVLERLPYGDHALLTVRARAVRPGVGTCTATIQHKDIGDKPLTTSVITHVSAPATTRR